MYHSWVKARLKGCCLFPLLQLFLFPQHQSQYTRTRNCRHHSHLLSPRESHCTQTPFLKHCPVLNGYLIFLKFSSIACSLTLSLHLSFPENLLLAVLLFLFLLIFKLSNGKCSGSVERVLGMVIHLFPSRYILMKSNKSHLRKSFLIEQSVEKNIHYICTK